MAIINEIVSNTVLLSDAVIPAYPRRISVSNTIVFEASPIFVPDPLRVGNNLSVPADSDIPVNELPDQSDPDFATKMAALTAQYALRQEVSVRHKVTNVAIAHILQLDHEAAHPIELSVSSHIPLSHVVRTDVTDFIIEDVIVFGNVAEGWVGQGPSHTLEFTDVATPGLVRVLTVTDTLSLVDAASHYFGSLATQTTCDTQTLAASVTFTFPYTGPTLTVTLRNPDLGNADALNYRRINRRDRGGSLEIFRRSIWPKTKRQRLQFSALTQEQRLEVFQLLNDSLGQDVGYLDHEGRQWRGIITTPASKVQEVGRFCDNEVTLEFQGELA